MTCLFGVTGFIKIVTGLLIVSLRVELTTVCELVCGRSCPHRTTGVGNRTKAVKVPHCRIHLVTNSVSTLTERARTQNQVRRYVQIIVVNHILKVLLGFSGSFRTH